MYCYLELANVSQFPILLTCFLILFKCCEHNFFVKTSRKSISIIEDINHLLIFLGKNHAVPLSFPFPLLCVDLSLKIPNVFFLKIRLFFNSVFLNNFCLHGLEFSFHLVPLLKENEYFFLEKKWCLPIDKITYTQLMIMVMQLLHKIVNCFCIESF